MLQISCFGQTHPGDDREINEDAYLVDQAQGLFAVADGLGGLPDGDQASRLTIESLTRHALNTEINGPEAFNYLFDRINREIYDEGQRRHKDIGIGTTLTCGCIRDDRFYIGHVGDSIAMVLSGGELEVLTEEHTIAALYGYGHSRRANGNLPEYFYHTLTRCIGANQTLETSSSEYQLKPGDRILLSSDGLTKVISLEEIKVSLKAAPSAEHACHQLIDLALKRKAPDNLAVVVVFVGPNQSA